MGITWQSKAEVETFHSISCDLGHFSLLSQISLSEAEVGWEKFLGLYVSVGILFSRSLRGKGPERGVRGSSPTEDKGCFSCTFHIFEPIFLAAGLVAFPHFTP